MYYFLNDYSEGALPPVMDALARTNGCATDGYGMDPYCREAAEKLRERFCCPDADVHFLMGGTQTNLTFLSAVLRPWEAVIAAETAHIATHETGAVEACGHKVLTVPSGDGKVRPEQIRQIWEAHGGGRDEHMVLPRLVYLSNATEMGTVYTRAELAAISQVCRELELYLYVDGARLAQAIAASGRKLRPEDLADLCDAFYLGGTKDGLLFGEALVICRDGLKPGFRHAVKQRGGMLAKGRLLGLQFSTFLDDDLWLSAAAHANEQAARLAGGLREAGVELLLPAESNLVFAVLPEAAAARLAQEFRFERWMALDGDRTAIRLVTSWATAPESVDALLEAVRSCV